MKNLTHHTECGEAPKEHVQSTGVKFRVGTHDKKTTINEVSSSEGDKSHYVNENKDAVN